MGGGWAKTAPQLNQKISSEVRNPGNEKKASERNAHAALQDPESQKGKVITRTRVDATSEEVEMAYEKR